MGSARLLAALLLSRPVAAAVATAECSVEGACPSSAGPLRVNASRLWASIEAMARVGAFESPGGERGVRREALTDADRRGRELLDGWAAELGLKREVDTMGNTYYRRPGRRPGAGVIALGSHLDSQPSGGRFDGSYGVLACLELLRTLHELGISTDMHLELVNWSNEEGSRFSPPIMGSGVATGDLAVEQALRSTARGQENVTFADELRRHGLMGKAAIGPGPRGWVAYFEPHIEQGPVLERAGAHVGVVLGGQGQRTFAVEVDGEEGHSGTVPMAVRSDALVCASSMVLRAREIATTHDVLATVGRLEVQPGSFNTIAGRVAFSLDLRSPRPLAAAEAELHHAFGAAVREFNCSRMSIKEVSSRPTVHFDPFLRAQLRDAAASLGLTAPELWSGAGHDACYVGNRVPAAMVFVPCARGISHNPRESAEAADLAAGADMLLGAVLRTDAALPWRQSTVREFYGKCTLDRRALARRTCKGACDVVFLGDSIMERMAGDDVCRSQDRQGRLADNAIFHATFARHGRSVILAGRSDWTNHTLHLLDTVLPVLKAPKLYSLLIGTNNIAFGDTVPGTIAGIKAVVQRLHQAHPSAAVLLHAVLPRSDNRRYHALNLEVNKGLRAFVDAQPDVAELLDCSHVFPEHSMKQLTWDGLHPNGEGYRRWYESCVRPALEGLVGPAKMDAD